MRKIILVAGLALALAACGGKSDKVSGSVGDGNTIVNEPDAPAGYNADECPRADGSPCA